MLFTLCKVEISQIPIFSISKQKGWFSWPCKLPCKNPYFIGKIRVRVCETEWTLTTDKPVKLLRIKCASPENWIGDGQTSSAHSEPPAARTPVRKGWRYQWRRCPMKLSICRADSLPVPERMLGTCGISEISRQDSELLQRDSCSRPLDPKIADNCSGWARTDLIIIGYWSMMLMMRMSPNFLSKDEILRLSNWLGISGWKPPLRLHMCPYKRSIPYTG